MEINNTDESKDLMKLIQMRFPRLSKGQKLIAEYILKNYNLDLKIDQCEAICIGKAFLIENKKMIEETK